MRTALIACMLGAAVLAKPKFYKASKEKVKWGQGVGMCKRMGGRLAVFRSAADLQALRDSGVVEPKPIPHASSQTVFDYWIALRRRYDNPWKWWGSTDKVCYAPWLDDKTDQPPVYQTKRCGYLSITASQFDGWTKSNFVSDSCPNTKLALCEFDGVAPSTSSCSPSWGLPSKCIHTDVMRTGQCGLSKGQCLCSRALDGDKYYPKHYAAACVDQYGRLKLQLFDDTKLLKERVVHSNPRGDVTHYDYWWKHGPVGLTKDNIVRWKPDCPKLRNGQRDCCPNDGCGYLHLTWHWSRIDGVWAPKIARLTVKFSKSTQIDSSTIFKEELSL